MQTYKLIPTCNHFNEMSTIHKSLHNNTVRGFVEKG